MCDCQQGLPSKSKPLLRETVDACWNCDNLALTDPIEHECDGGLTYCLWDGNDVHPFNKCENWKLSRKFKES